MKLSIFARQSAFIVPFKGSQLSVTSDQLSRFIVHCSLLPALLTPKYQKTTDKKLKTQDCYYGKIIHG
ncbi:hypothetical protein [Trichormus azollae]|uniref:hypothetical protein n=1 Tax=Trichormus azollae TaxID=1164 RepID=UPI0005A17E81|nr:hypothetical protein [Trichormus azollae]